MMSWVCNKQDIRLESGLLLLNGIHKPVNNLYQILTLLPPQCFVKPKNYHGSIFTPELLMKTKKYGYKKISTINTATLIMVALFVMTWSTFDGQTLRLKSVASFGERM